VSAVCGGERPCPHFLVASYKPQRPSVWYEDGTGKGIRSSSRSRPVVHSSPDSRLGDLTFHDTAKALLSGEIQFLSGQALNHSGVHHLAIQLAVDYYSWQVAVALDESYPGTYKWTLEGTHDVIWTYSTRTRRDHPRRQISVDARSRRFPGMPHRLVRVHKYTKRDWGSFRSPIHQG